jgi:hypothetical protein
LVRGRWSPSDLRRQQMKLDRSVVAIVALFMALVVLPKGAAADEWNERTIVTFSQNVEVSGTVLPAGTYVLQLADSQMDRHIVQVFNQHGDILATALTIPAVRSSPTNDTKITFDEGAAGSPHPIKAWFYPGRRDGEEFLRPNRSKSATTD